MVRRSGNRTVVRERNEQGFNLFLQQVKSVLTLFTRKNAFQTTDDLLESRRRLTDATGTLTLLIYDDIGRGNVSTTSETLGMQSDDLHEGLLSLKNDLLRIIEAITDILSQRDDTDFYDKIDFAYSAPKSISGSGPGRKQFEISKEQIEHLRSLYFSWENIAKMLRVSISTLQRRRKEFSIDEELTGFSNISDEELDTIHKEVTGTIETGPITPNIGRRRFLGALRSRGIRVPRWRASECLKRVDPVGTALRWRMLIKRRKYYVPTPNSLWHIDSGHKLIKYKIITHVCIDGKTRLLLYVNCSNNNKANTVLSLFTNAVERWGLPSRVRSDYGMENYYVGAHMLEHRGTDIGSIITGSSVHNCRVERSHRDVYSGVLAFYSRIFEELEDEGCLDVLNEVNIFCLHHVFLPRMQRSLDEFVQQMNNRPVSTEGNQSPIQMWERGMLENINSNHTSLFLSKEDMEDFGIEPEGPYGICDEDYQVDLVPLTLDLPNDCLEMLPHPLSNDNDNGKSLYINSVEVVVRFYIAD